MAKKNITQLDLFSGIGGFHLGFEKAGYKVKSYFSEIDKHAIAVYKHQFKDSIYAGSVVDIRGNELPRIDLITFGSPCQDFSLAGKRAGLAGDRSGLILEAIRLIRECRPSVFIWENVKGSFSSNDGRDFAAILQEFTNIGGYRLEWQLLNTSWVLPQNRERVYLVGYSTKPGRNWRGVFPITQDNGKVDNRDGWKSQSAQTLTARYFASTAQGSYIIERDQVQKIRRLTPIECERLQGFPDNHTEYGIYDGEVKKMSNTQRYKQCGNAVTVDIVALVAEAVKPLFK